MRTLIFLFGLFDPYDFFNSRELCAQYGVPHPKDTWAINVPPVVFAVAVLAVIGAFGTLFYFVGHARRFW